MLRKKTTPASLRQQNYNYNFTVVKNKDKQKNHKDKFLNPTTGEETLNIVILKLCWGTN